MQKKMMIKERGMAKQTEMSIFFARLLRVPSCVGKNKLEGAFKLFVIPSSAFVCGHIWIPPFGV